jgi:hypothetical protein
MSTMKSCNRVDRNGHVNGLMDRPRSWNMTYDPSAEFPEVPVGCGMTTQLVWLTPDLASEWLGKKHPRQRPQKMRHQESLNEDHKSGRFRLNGEPIIFDWDGAMIDGRHRCEMVRAVGVPVLVLVVRGVSPEVYVTIDDGAKRTGADALAADSLTNGTNLAAAAGLLERYRRKLSLSNPIVFSPAAVSEIVKAHPRLIESVSRSTAFQGFPSRATIGFCHYILSGISATTRFLIGSCLATDWPGPIRFSPCAIASTKSQSSVPMWHT